MSEPLREILHCPNCGRQHVDGRWWAHKAHVRHNCMFKACGHVWNEDHASIGVRSVTKQAMNLAEGSGE